MQFYESDAGGELLSMRYPCLCIAYIRTVFCRGYDCIFPRILGVTDSESRQGYLLSEKAGRQVPFEMHLLADKQKSLELRYIMGLESAKFIRENNTVFHLIQKVGAFFRPAVFWLPEVWHAPKIGK